MSAPRKKTYTNAQKAKYYKSLAYKNAKAKKPAYKKRYNKPRIYRQPYNSVGANVGAMLGHGIQQLVKSVTGFGDYKIENNSLLSGGMTPPQIINSSAEGGIIVRHREYIQDISSTIAFTNLVMDLNPGLNGTFPWLSGIANCFEQYRWRGMIFEFKSTSSDAVLAASATSSLGSVMLATQYNVLEPNFVDKVKMLNHEFSNSGKPSQDILHPIECKRAVTPLDKLYVRNSAIPANADQRLYDLGKFQIATEGQQAASAGLGELWVTYEVELFKPHLETVDPNMILSAHYTLGTWSAANPMGTASTLSASSSLEGTINATGLTYTFPSDVEVGKYLVSIEWHGTVAAVCNTPAISFVNCAGVNLFIGNSSYWVFTPVATNSTYCALEFALSISAAGASFTLGAAGTLPTGANISGDMMITQLDDDLVN